MKYMTVQLAQVIEQVAANSKQYESPEDKDMFCFTTWFKFF